VVIHSEKNRGLTCRKCAADHWPNIFSPNCEPAAIREQHTESLLSSTAGKKEIMGISNKIMLQHILLIIPRALYGKCLMTEESAKDCGFLDPSILVVVTFISRRT
jgi:hypothetical protein